MKAKRASLWYIISEKSQKYPDATVLWTREREWTWKQVTDAASQYARFFLSQGVRPGQGVSFYLLNHAEFMIAWLGLLQLGCWPAMINYNLEGTALVHCLKVSGSNLVFVDDDNACRARIDNSRNDIEQDLGMKIVHLDAATKREIAAQSTQILEDEYPRTASGITPAAIFYTR